MFGLLSEVNKYLDDTFTLWAISTNRQSCLLLVNRVGEKYQDLTEVVLIHRGKTVKHL